jgi:hypothetical protein
MKSNSRWNLENGHPGSKGWKERNRDRVQRRDREYKRWYNGTAAGILYSVNRHMREKLERVG